MLGRSAGGGFVVRRHVGCCQLWRAATTDADPAKQARRRHRDRGGCRDHGVRVGDGPSTRPSATAAGVRASASSGCPDAGSTMAPAAGSGRLIVTGAFSATLTETASSTSTKCSLDGYGSGRSSEIIDFESADHTYRLQF